MEMETETVQIWAEIRCVRPFLNALAGESVRRLFQRKCEAAGTETQSLGGFGNAQQDSDFCDAAKRTLAQPEGGAGIAPSFCARWFANQRGLGCDWRQSAAVSLESHTWSVHAPGA
ncbi:hypothetical protein PF011_g2586 [Phytophthora fragariae]|uniref:Uncharacterized protein n=1 Tax=Phytophthora fragariae TaxID=53985 RepID=A0A6A3M9K2_9STRA|nr:hypothetical protein PF003_g8493 [Phytophthora fragariae]KAE9026355.1 hypothetical protein PF011_g2586 [Phytophthora fragariae]